MNPSGSELCCQGRHLITVLTSLLVMGTCKLFMYSGFNFGRSHAFRKVSISSRLPCFGSVSYPSVLLPCAGCILLESVVTTFPF